MIQNGYTYVLVCAFSFGLITTIAKMTYDEAPSPETVVFFEFWLAASSWESGQV